MVTFTDNTNEFKRKFEETQKAVLEQVGKFVKSKMDEYVAVDTGNLRSHNSYAVRDNSCIIWNFCEYAIYQEYGTYKMAAHPFFRIAVQNHMAEINAIIEAGFRNGIG